MTCDLSHLFPTHFLGVTGQRSNQLNYVPREGNQRYSENPMFIGLLQLSHASHCLHRSHRKAAITVLSAHKPPINRLCRLPQIPGALTVNNPITRAAEEHRSFHGRGFSAENIILLRQKHSGLRSGARVSRRFSRQESNRPHCVRSRGDPQHLRASGLQACVAERHSFLPRRVLDPVRSLAGRGMAQAKGGADVSAAE
jgi:hypothetical protein